MARRTAGWPAVAVLVASACGTTAQPPGQVGAPLPGPSRPATSSAPAADTPVTRLGAAGTAGSQKRVVGADLPVLPPAGRRSASRPELPTVRSDGVDERRLRIGIATSQKLRSGADHRPVLDAVAAFVNASGGVAGRRLELVVSEIPSDPEEQFEVRQAPHQQAACADLTQDASVLAVLNLTKFARFGVGCYIDARVPSYALGMGGLNEAELRRSAQWVLPGAQPHLERLARELPVLLAQHDALGTRIGVLALDLPQHRDLATRVLVPGLTRVGGNVVTTTFLRPDDPFAGPRAAVLRFKSDRVDRVVLWLGGEGPWQLFASAAEEQDYRPEYAFTTLNLPGLAQAKGRVLPTHLARALGVGWDPYTDGVTVRPRGTAKACFDAVARRLGTAYVAENGLGVALVCEQLLLLRDALRPATGRVLRRTDVASLYRALGDWQPLAVPLARFRPDKIDGAAVHAVLRYDAERGQFTYATPWQRWPEEG